MNLTPFSQQVAYLEKGTLDIEATELLAELVKAVRETRKKGSLTLKLNVKMHDNMETVVIVAADLSVNAPEHARAATILFAAGDGDLLRDDPEQQSIPSLTNVKDSNHG